MFRDKFVCPGDYLRDDDDESKSDFFSEPVDRPVSPPPSKKRKTVAT
jgi:hypothetical protein